MTDEEKKVQKFADTIVHKTSGAYGIMVNHDLNSYTITDLEHNIIATIKDPESFYKFLDTVKNS